MKVAVLQSPLAWENVEENKKQFIKQLNEIQQDVDLVVLPEMFTSGFTMQPERVYMTMEDEFLAHLTEIANQKNMAIIGSVVIKENQQFFNRLLFIEPSKELHYYDKRHLFSLAGEEKVYTAGQNRIIVNYKGWRICPLVCYDLRFPVFARNSKAEYDLLIYVASWPDQRIYAWDTIIKARAIENMSYVIGVNRCGSDENNNVYSGHSQVIDYMGKYLIEPLVGQQVATVSLDLGLQNKARDRFGFLRDADQFTIDLK
ncbi:amidohydrolase [Myroides albus]|uniref:Omega-amidase YafV n=1 Tax=Myroides albus TaxID=2562892 RepID=A0A6I3LMX6_9FLAO|nr:amidohydrolase [Myroides albus]MTG97532.1 amidohydrolase [Myroides albus]UVD81191.1 amidohydrolase [Myroides albus]